jgi:hypothetical protein
MSVKKERGEWGGEGDDGGGIGEGVGGRRLMGDGV